MSAPEIDGRSDMTREERIKAFYDYLSEHAFDALDNAMPWNPRDFYSTWLSFYGLHPGPIGPQSSSAMLTTSGDTLQSVSLSGLDVSYDMGSRLIGQRMTRVGDGQSIFFADQASGWSLDGGVPYIRLSYFPVDQQVNLQVCNGGTCTYRSACTYLRRGSLHMGGEIFEFVSEGSDLQCKLTGSVTVGSAAPPPSCLAPSGCTPSLDAVRFRSVRGGMIFDLSGAVPILYLRDGTKFVMNGSTQSAWNNPLDWPSTQGTTIADYGPSMSISPNGEITRYAWVNGTANRQIFQITDSRGRVKSWDPGNEFLKPRAGDTWTSTWTVPGPQGVPQVHSIHWTAMSYDPRAAFPELVSDPSLKNFCTNFFNSTFDMCAPVTVGMITSIGLPDGRSYQFGYGPFLNLVSATNRDGAVIQWDYGDPSNNLPGGNDFVQAFVTPVFNRGTDPPLWNYAWAGRMQSRAPIAARSYPMGLTGPVLRSTKTSFCEPLAAPLSGCKLFWTTIVRADGSVEKFARTPAANAAGGLMPSTVVAHEIWPVGAGAPIEATYGGDPATGLPWTVAENSGGFNDILGLHINPRPTRTQTLRDGIVKTEVYSYDTAAVTAASSHSWDPAVASAGASAPWSNGNATLAVLQDTNGTAIRKTSTTYLAAPAYVNQSMTHLPLSTVLMDAAGNVVTREDFGYDENPVAPSGQTGLDATYTTAARGNVTSTTNYKTPASATGPVTARAWYYDNGTVQKTQSPVDHAAGRFTTTTTFANAGGWQCPVNPLPTTIATNALGQSIASVSDCWSGLALSITDPNGAKTCNQYDWLGRLVEMAAPGDTLTALPAAATGASCSVTSIPLCGASCNSCTVCRADPQCLAPPTDPCNAGGRSCAQGNWSKSVALTAACFDCGSTPNTCTVTDPSVCGLASGGYLRDPGCATAAGTAVGNGGAGPTAWTEYFPFGVQGTSYFQARTLLHAKDGTADGRTSKTFVDGAGRTLETCSEIDPSTSSGAGTNTEACHYFTYDAMGRAYQISTPFYATTGTTAAAALPAGSYSQSCYDALGRMTGAGLIWAGSWTCGGSPPATSLATLTSYARSGNNAVTLVTDPRGAQSSTSTNLLGQTVEVDQYKCAGSPCSATTGTPIVTTLQYDVAGRLLKTLDPGNNAMTFTYDGLGRKLTMDDPDMGHWAYAYDDNGNVTQQTDARQNTISIYYDPLDRPLVKDLPPAGPGPEDEVATYDGNFPVCSAMPCASSYSAGNLSAVCCDDRNPATADSCDPATVTCNARASSVVNSCTPGATRVSPCGDCGTSNDTCGPDGLWVSGACAGAGGQRTAVCGNCGTEIDTCGATGSWVAGACAGQGVCAPGSQRSFACGPCATETDTCSASCQWSGSCTGAGVCTPGTSLILGTCSDAQGNPGHTTETCSASCQYGASSCVVCTPGTTGGCDDLGICSSCSGTCTPGHHTCSSAGAWGTCLGARCTQPCVGSRCIIQP
jgi:YD repeat-containing protein